MLLRPYPVKDLIHKTPPFLASRSLKNNETGELEKEVSFQKGKVFQCYNNFYKKEEDAEEESAEEILVEGSKWHYPKNISEKFDYEDGDKFYLRPDKYLDQSEIVKTDSPQEGDILIWEAENAVEESEAKQYLSNHVYLQNIDEYRQLSFSQVLLEVKEDGSKRYRLNGGWVIIKDMGVYEYVPSFEYTLEKDEYRFFYIQTEVKITRSDEETWGNSGRKYVKGITATGISKTKEGYEIQFRGDKIALIYGTEAISQEEQAFNSAYIGKGCARTPSQKAGEFASLSIGSFDSRGLDRLGGNKNHGVYWTALGGGGDIYLSYETLNQSNSRAGDVIAYKVDFNANPPRISDIYVSTSDPFETSCDIGGASYLLYILAYDERDVLAEDYKSPVSKGGVVVAEDEIPNYLDPEFTPPASTPSGEDDEDDDEIEVGGLVTWTVYGSFKSLGKKYEVLQIKVPDELTIFPDDEEPAYLVKREMGTECEWQAAGFGDTTFYEFVEARFHQVTSEVVLSSEGSYNQVSLHDSAQVLGLPL